MISLLRAYKYNRTIVDQYNDHIHHPYANKTNYTKTILPSLFNNYQQQEQQRQGRERLKLVAWRQTSAQHYNTTGGHYADEANFTGPCVVHPSEDSNGDGYRLDLMKQAANASNFTFLNVLDPNFFNIVPPRRNNNYNNNNANKNPEDDDNNNIDELVLLPYRQYTDPLSYFHPNECSHYCHDPHLWLPIWRTLRIAMDRTVRFLEID